MTKPATGESASEAMARHQTVMAQREKALNLMARQAAARKAESHKPRRRSRSPGNRRASYGWEADRGLGHLWCGGQLGGSRHPGTPEGGELLVMLYAELTGRVTNAGWLSTRS